MIGVTDDIAACRAIRHAVFVVEQAVPEEEEWDGLDEGAIHLLARDAAGRPVGTARILLKGDMAKIGRVAVLREARGSGVGAGLMRAALAHLAGIGGVRRATLGAQTHAIGFYERLGFVAHGPEYDDAGIPHRDMTIEF